MFNVQIPNRKINHYDYDYDYDYDDDGGGSVDFW